MISRITLVKLRKVLPSPVREILKKLGINRSPLFWDKYSIELGFQADWANEFKEHKSKVLEYWKKYRYFDKIKKTCNIKKRTKILDVGCGISTVLHFLEGKKYGIDPLADYYKKFYSYPKDIVVKKGQGEHITFPDKYFDVVFCSNALDHVTNPQKTVDEIYRVLKKGGHFVLTVDLSKDKMKKDAAHPHNLDKKDVHMLLKNKFKILFEKESPWIGLICYTRGSIKAEETELVLISRKIQ